MYINNIIDYHEKIDQLNERYKKFYDGLLNGNYTDVDTATFLWKFANNNALNVGSGYPDPDVELKLQWMETYVLDEVKALQYQLDKQKMEYLHNQGRLYESDYIAFIEDNEENEKLLEKIMEDDWFWNNEATLEGRERIK